MEFITTLFGSLFYGFVVLAFVAAVLLLEGLYLTWNAYKAGGEAHRASPARHGGRRRWRRSIDSEAAHVERIAPFSACSLVCPVYKSSTGYSSNPAPTGAWHFF